MDNPSINAIDLLKEYHRLVATLLDKIADSTERAVVARKELFDQLKLNLDVHAHIEETIFYPAIEEEKETHKIVLESYEEHALVKDLLSELEVEDHQTEEWTAQFMVLKENVEHHVKEEEDEMFPEVKKILGEEKLLQLGNQMKMEKEKFIEE